MRRTRWPRIAVVSVGLVLALVAAACQNPDLQGPLVSSAGIPQTTGTPETSATFDALPTATPVPGVSDSVIRLGVIVDSSASDVITGGSEAAWLAMRAWALKVNSGGGLAGRDVEVVRVETSVFDHEIAIQEVCESDLFALVGSYALFDGDGVDILNDESCRLPDFPAAALNPARRESPVTFVSNPTSNDLWPAGATRYLAQRFPEAANQVGTAVLDLPVALFRAEREIEAAVAGGFNFVFQSTIGIDGNYDSLIEALVEAGAQAVTWSADRGRMLELLDAQARLADADVSDGSEAQGPLDLAFIHCISDCYSRRWADEVGDRGEDVWVSISIRPFEEPGENSALLEYLFYLNQIDPGADSEIIGLSSWASALLFEEAVNRALFNSGGALARELVIEAASTITEWDGRGLHGMANPAEGIPSACYMLVSPRNGGWIRRYPLTQGTMDCNPDNLVQLTTSSTLGLSQTAELSQAADDS